MTSAIGHGLKSAVLWAIIYARVSTDEQARSGYSLAQQIEASGRWCTREGYEVLEVITDPGQSGASLERPGMDRVRDLVAEGGVSVVLAQDRDRFAREPAYHYLLKRSSRSMARRSRALNDRGRRESGRRARRRDPRPARQVRAAKTAERTRRAGSGRRGRGRS